MSLSDADKASVRRYLGYPDVNRLANPGVEGAMVAISAEGEAIVSDLLTQVGEIDAQLRTSWSRQKVKKAEDVVLAGWDEIDALRQEGRRLVAELAALLDVSPLRDVFAGSSDSGLTGWG